MKPNNYERRKNVMSKQDMARMGKWARQPDNQDAAKIDRSQLWVALNQFISERGGKIVSPLHAFPIRLETDPDSELPDALEKLGYDLQFREQATRIGGPVSPEYAARWRRRAISPGYGHYTVKVYEVDIPTRSDTAPGKTGIAVQ